MTDFDMDMHIKKHQVDKPMFAVVLKKKTDKSADRFFIVIKKGENLLTTVFHGVGFWSGEIPQLDPNMTASQQFLSIQTYEEVWIPYENIDYIKSLVYIKR
jgi:hypothetical protein